jgi:hypothetical protein
VEKSVQNPEMSNFNEALRQVMRVSKSDLKEILAKEKAANADKPKRGPKNQRTSNIEHF